MQTEVRRNAERSRYELFVDGQLTGHATYVIDGDQVVFPHTEIASRSRGQGLGDVLVRGALDDVRGGGQTVVPLCWFVAEFIAQNREYQDLVTA